MNQRWRKRRRKEGRDPSSAVGEGTRAHLSSPHPRPASRSLSHSLITARSTCPQEHPLQPPELPRRPRSARLLRRNPTRTLLLLLPPLRPPTSSPMGTSSFTSNRPSSKSIEECWRRQRSLRTLSSSAQVRVGREEEGYRRSSSRIPSKIGSSSFERCTMDCEPTALNLLLVGAELTVSLLLLQRIHRHSPNPAADSLSPPPRRQGELALLLPPPSSPRLRAESRS